MKRADHHLVQQVLDGEINRDAFDAFQQRLRDDPKLAQLYGDYALLHHTLCEEFEGGHFSGQEPSAPPRSLLGIPALLAGALLIAVAAVLGWLQPWTERGKLDDVAMVTFSVDAVWQIDGDSLNPGGATCVAKGSRLRLSQGRASISLEPLVTAVIEGPAELGFLSKESLHLERGRGFFHRGGTAGGLTVTTPGLTVVDSGTEFGIEVVPGGSDELHVTQGSVQMHANRGHENAVLAAGAAVRVTAAGWIERFPADGKRFATGLGHFRSVVSGPFVKSQWRMDYGHPSISEHRIEGANYSAFLRLPEPEPAGGNTVLLATLEVGKPAAGEFHTDGWAGMSFFSNGNEVLFFGDSFGAKPTWSLDVKQHIPVILPEHPVVGPRTVTLRYDLRTGETSLHDGGVPMKAPFCTGKLPAGVRFDEIRVGASSGASLTVDSLHVRVGGD